MIAPPRTFKTDMRLGWGFYGHRLHLYRQTQPHAGFGILKRWVDAMPLGARVFTSNVDGQFQKAGFAPEQLHECHGSIHHLQCMEPCQPSVWPADNFAPEVDEASCRLQNAPPLCPACGGLARPNILMFGDWGWQDGRQEAQYAREDAWFAQVTAQLGRVVVVEMGAGTAIPSVRNFSQRVSRRYGARIIRINPRESQVPSGDQRRGCRHSDWIAQGAGAHRRGAQATAAIKKSPVVYATTGLFRLLGVADGARTHDNRNHNPDF